MPVCLSVRYTLFLTIFTGGHAELALEGAGEGGQVIVAATDGYLNDFAVGANYQLYSLRNTRAEVRK